jgi:hypothetical protein
MGVNRMAQKQIGKNCKEPFSNPVKQIATSIKTPANGKMA